MAEEKRTTECPGCDVEIVRTLVACNKCWHKVPQEYKSAIHKSTPGGINRMRAVGNARLWLAAHR